MKAGTTHYLHRAFVECSGHEVLGGVHQQAVNPRQPSKRTNSLEQPFARTSRPMPAMVTRSHVAWSSPQNRSVFMIIYRSLRQRLSKLRQDSSQQRRGFLIDERKAERIETTASESASSMFNCGSKKDIGVSQACESAVQSLAVGLPLKVSIRSVPQSTSSYPGVLFL
jgi:hypothetical protein